MTKKIINGVGRLAENEKFMFVSFTRPLTDDEMAQFHALIRAPTPPQTA